MKARMHDDFIQAGFSHEHFPHELEDYGDAESGPMIYFSPELDVYMDSESVFVFNREGALVEITMRDHKFEEYMDQQEKIKMVDIDTAIQNYTNACNENYQKYCDRQGRAINTSSPSFEYELKTKYAIIYRVSGTAKSAHAFVVLSDADVFPRGTILKPKNFKAPTKNFSRGNVFGDFKRASNWSGL